ncbi:MAG: hypothetical protein ACXU7H_12095 [Burkholderiaceae bacterium]
MLFINCRMSFWQHGNSSDIDLPPSNESTPTMTTTYYLLRTKESAVGNGSYLFHNSDGELALTTSVQDAQHFETIEAAEQYATQMHANSETLTLRTSLQDTRGFDRIESAEQYVAEVNEKFGIFEVEVRNSIN